MRGREREMGKEDDNVAWVLLRVANVSEMSGKVSSCISGYIYFFSWKASFSEISILCIDSELKPRLLIIVTLRRYFIFMLCETNKGTCACQKSILLSIITNG